MHNLISKPFSDRIELKSGLNYSAKTCTQRYDGKVCEKREGADKEESSNLN